MTKIKIEPAKFSGQPKYRILDSILDLLLTHGNELATDYRWGSNPTGYFAVLKKPIDFNLIRDHFELPGAVILDEKFGEVDYGIGTVIIRSE